MAFALLPIILPAPIPGPASRSGGWAAP